MKKIKFAAVLALAGLAAAAFAQEQKAEPPQQAAAVKNTAKQDYSFLNDKTGIVTVTNFSEKSFKDIMNKRLGTRIKEFVFSDSMSGSLFMLKSGRADFMLTSDIVANYVTQRNPDLRSAVFPLENNLVMLLRVSDERLRDQFDSAISKLKASGMLDEVYKRWVTDLPAGQEPAMPEIDKTAFTETIYVGVSGDRPPLDYVSADGKPAGYNLALLAKISKIIGKNIEVLTIDAPARFAALESKKIDVFFWQVKPNSRADEKFINKMAETAVFAKKFIVTRPYCTIKAAVLLKK